MNYYSNLDVKNKRKLLKSQIDQFASFKWQGYDMFDKFGMFIINEKREGLKFYNGPSFSNVYSKPHFQEGNSNLLGINFNTQSINFKVGIYYFTEQEYSELLELFSPYVIGDLVFDFNSAWRYKVKLKSIQDSTRYILDRSPAFKIIDHEQKSLTYTEQYYYTEWNLQFEVQGPSCLYATNPYQWTVQTKANIIDQSWEVEAYINKDLQDYQIIDNWHRGYFSSNLDFPIKYTSSLLLTDDLKTDLKLQLVAEWSVPNSSRNIVMPLFDCTFNYDSISKLGNTFLNFTYYSESGILLWNQGNNTDQILNLRSLDTNGKRLLKKYKVYKYKIPGKTDLSSGKIKLITNLNNTSTDRIVVQIEAYARTNII